MAESSTEAPSCDGLSPVTGEIHSQAVDERVLPRPRANNSQQSRGGILLTGFVVSFCGAAGLQGRVGGKVELARGLRHETSLK
jgi:hypothetical protein